MIPAPAAAQIPRAAAPAAPAPPTAGAVFQRLLAARLDPARVFRVDGLDIDDEDLHFTLIHGTLAFLPPNPDLPAEIGAVFSGQGEMLLMPPDAADRLAMANFTGAAILDEQFHGAYFVLTDGALRLATADLAEPVPAAAGAAFCRRWAAAANEINGALGLRLLTAALDGNRAPFFFARVAGEHLGAFNALVDRSLPEQIVVARRGAGANTVPGDVWASFPMRSARLRPRPAPRDVAVESYRVRTDIRADLLLSGDATLSLRALDPGERVLTFALGRGLRVSGVSDGDGRPLAWFQNGALRSPNGAVLASTGASNPENDEGDLVAAILPAPLAAGQRFQLRFRYAGRIIFAAANGLYALADRADWFPNRPGEPAPHDLSFIYPSDLTLVATGRRAPPAADAATPPIGYAAGRWVSSLPLPLAGFNLGKFQTASTRLADAGRPVAITVYAAQPAQPAPPAAAAASPAASGPSPGSAGSAGAAVSLQTIADETARTIAFYAARFGPFPYSQLAVTELPLPLGQGWPGLLYLAQDSFLSPAQLENVELPAASRLEYPLMRPHEIAHQWWGDDVGWATYHDQWLPEALASCSALLYEESRPGGAERARRILAQDRADLLAKNARGQTIESAGPIWLGRRLNSSRFPTGYETIVYDKGAWVLHMLREMLRPPPAPGAAQSAALANPTADAAPASLQPDARDARFFALLRAFRRRFAGRAATSADFEAVANQFMTPDLNLGGDGTFAWFFQEWLHWTGLPAYSLQNIGRRAHRVTGELEQAGVPQGFAMPVPLYLRAPDGTLVYLGRVDAEGPETRFSLPVPPGTPADATLVVDPNNAILKQ